MKLPLSLKFTTLVCFLPVAGIGQAASVWLGGAGNYDATENWNPSGIPSPATDVTVAAGVASRTGNLDRAANTEISGTGGITIDNGRFLNASGGAGTVNMSGGTLNQTGNYYIVSLNNTGAFNQSGGTVNSTVDRGWFMSDGANSTGNYQLTGGSLNVSLSGTGGNANYAVSIGRNSGADVLRVAGGTANFTAPVADVRSYISRGALMQVDSGAATFNDFRFIVVGRDGGASPETASRLIINGGTTTANLRADGALVVGNGGAGQMQVNGGSLLVTGAPLWIGDGAQPGSVVQNDGTVTLTGTSVILSHATSSGTYTMNGGVLDAFDISIGTGVDPLFNFNGGEILLSGDRTSILGESWFLEAPGAVASFDPVSNKTRLSVVPEAGSALLSLLGLTAFMRRRR